MITCTFAGHKEAYQFGIPDALDRSLADLLSGEENEFCFWPEAWDSLMQRVPLPSVRQKDYSQSSLLLR